MSVMRRLKRNVAKCMMNKEGILNKHKDFGSGSYFANNWRDYVAQASKKTKYVK